MGKNVKRLAVIYAELYNSLMTLLEQTSKRQKLLSDVKQTATETELVNSYADMHKSVKNKSSLADTDIVNFLRKKDKYLNETAVQPQNPQPANNNNADGSAAKALVAGTIAYHEKLITNHMKAKGITDTGKGVKYQGKTMNFSYEDMIEDLTKNSKNTNLTNAQHDKMLRTLKKSNMPTKYIRNKLLREKYKNLDIEQATQEQAGPAFQKGPTFETPKGRPKTTRQLGQKRNYMLEGYFHSLGNTQ
ncbi:Hypothetical predicted protein [Paramuricea clavata]|uniref:Uncharacterized protein n=1 Tax=Paramuricea clavata TaxID=317549 RepID=A0A6S7GNB5_PARCT|nr:Hypothetical predicted protein [Paramuricea clavata]